MKCKILFLLFIQSLLTSSCNKPTYVLDDFILAGQKSGSGIRYIDHVPDIHCTIIDPWKKTDTVFLLDLNKDGTDDFRISGSMCAPHLLGGDCEELSITPLSENEVCISPNTGWLDTIPHLDTIHAERNWSGTEALIYSYDWMYGQAAIRKGNWQDETANGTYYIGLRIKENGKSIFGWFGIRKIPKKAVFSFLITDYGMLKEYVAE